MDEKHHCKGVVIAHNLQKKKASSRHREEAFFFCCFYCLIKQIAVDRSFKTIFAVLSNPQCYAQYRLVQLR